MIRLSILEWILGGICVVAVPVAAIQTWRVHAKSEEIDTLKLAGKACQGANQTNQTTIAGLERAVERWELNCAFDPIAQNQAITNLTTAAAALQSEAAEATAAREALYARDPKARTWADSGMPADVAGGLFKRPRPDARR